MKVVQNNIIISTAVHMSAVRTLHSPVLGVWWRQWLLW